VAANVLLLALFAYTLFWGYFPVKQHSARLERELHHLYVREADLVTRIEALERAIPPPTP
jgi:hypothetical protein